MPDSLPKPITVPAWGALGQGQAGFTLQQLSRGSAWTLLLSSGQGRAAPRGARVLLPQKNGLKSSRCLRAWMVSWLWPSTHFLMACKTRRNVLVWVLGLVCLSWPGAEASVPGHQLQLRGSGGSLKELRDLCHSLCVPEMLTWLNATL